MNKRKIDVMDYASDIVKELPKGIFLNTRKQTANSTAWRLHGEQ